MLKSDAKLYLFYDTTKLFLKKTQFLLQSLPDSPFIWIKVVGSVAKILHEADRMRLVGEQYEVARGLRVRHDVFPMEVL